MALFSKESGNNPKPSEAAKRTTPWVSPKAARHAETVHYEEVPARMRASAPAGHDVPAGYDRACLDSGSKINGKLFFEGPVRIDGQVDGEISAKDSVVIGEGAIVTAPLKGASVVIAGKVNGDIQASKRIEIRPTAKVFGNLTTPVLVVHDGALFVGQCTMHTEAKEDRSVTPVAAKEESVVRQPAVESNKLA
jgi:cytoskeletal protein CcmA (bactofilin family)